MSIAAYPEYRRVELVGLRQIPATWTTGPFKRLINIQNGADHKHVQQDEGYPVYGSGGPFTCSSEFLYDGESVLLGRKGTINQPLHVNGPFWTVDTMYWTKIRDGVCGRFAYYVASAFPFDFYKTNTAVPSMTQRALGDHIIPIPPLPEQKLISAFLDNHTAKIDATIATQEELVTLLTEKLAVSIANAITGRAIVRMPKEYSGVEWLGEVPAHWQVRRLASLFHEVNQPSDETRPILSISIHHGASDDELSEGESGRKVTRSEDRSTYKAVEPGDLVYNMMRAWQGGFGAVTVQGAVSPAYVVARSSSPHLAEFVELVLRTPNAIAEMKRHSRGITDFRMRLYWDRFKDIEIAIPPEHEMIEILEHVRRLKFNTSRIVDAAKRMNSMLRERRAALISAAVTGKIDVRGYNENNDREAA